MKRVELNLDLDSALKTLVANTHLEQKVAETAEKRLKRKNNEGVVVNPGVDKMEIGKVGGAYIKESGRIGALQIGEQTIKNFDPFNEVAFIGRDPENHEVVLYSINGGNVEETRCGFKDASVSRIDMAISMSDDGKHLEVFNLGKNDAIIEVEDEF
jgi:hypothetical protein